MSTNLRRMILKLFLVAVLATSLSTALTTASANTLSCSSDGSICLSCGSSAGNYIFSCASGTCDYFHGGLWQFYADFLCGDA